MGARSEDLLYGPIGPISVTGWPVVASATNGVATATKAGAAGTEHFVTGISMSAGGTIAAAVTAQLLDGVTVIDQWELPNAAIAPIIVDFKRALRIASGALVSLTIPALGTNIKGTAVLRGFSRQAN